MSGLRTAADHPYFDNGGYPIAFAHRGGALTGGSVGLENSLLAFEAAVALGYRYVETDVHATSDGAVLAFHDTTLERLTDGSGLIATMTLDEMRRFLIGGREQVPLLSDVLGAWPELKLNVDAKSDAAVEPLARLIAEHDAWDRVCVASFSPRRLHRLRDLLGPRAATAYGTFGVAALRFLPGRTLRRRLLGPVAQAAQVPVRHRRLEVISAGFTERAHELGKQVHVWTIDAPEEMERLLDLGVDGIMSDRIDLLRDVYQSRGIWRDTDV